MMNIFIKMLPLEVNYLLFDIIGKVLNKLVGVKEDFVLVSEPALLFYHETFVSIAERARTNFVHVLNFLLGLVRYRHVIIIIVVRALLNTTNDTHNSGTQLIWLRMLTG